MRVKVYAYILIGYTIFTMVNVAYVCFEWTYLYHQDLVVNYKTISLFIEFTISTYILISIRNGIFKIPMRLCMFSIALNAFSRTIPAIEYLIYINEDYSVFLSIVLRAFMIHAITLTPPIVAYLGLRKMASSQSSP
jgi:hypothetical protein